MSDEEFMARFEDSTLHPFRHCDHVHTAFLYLRRFPALEALRRFSEALVRLAASQGKPELYHETITWAFVFLIRERMARAGGEQSWAGFAADNADLLAWEANVLLKYYQRETLDSDLAKRTFVLPDRSVGLAGPI